MRNTRGTQQEKKNPLQELHAPFEWEKGRDGGTGNGPEERPLCTGTIFRDYKDQEKGREVHHSRNRLGTIWGDRRGCEKFVPAAQTITLIKKSEGGKHEEGSGCGANKSMGGG